MSNNKFENADNHFGESEYDAPKVDERENRVELPYVLNFGRTVKIGEKTFEQLEFKYEPTMRAMKHMPVDQEAMKLGHFIPVVASMTDWSTARIEELPFPLFSRCIEVVSPFLRDSENEKSVCE